MHQKPEFYHLKARSFSSSEPCEVYSARFDACGWAIIFLHEQSGTVAIHSDYGDWVFSWPANGRGERTIKEFICEAGFDYLAGKFEHGKEREFDLEATKKRLVEGLNETISGDPGLILKGTVAEMKEWLDEDCPENPILMNENMPEDWLKVTGGAPYEFFVYDHPQSFYWLRDGILPALIAELRKTLPEKKTAEAEETSHAH